MPGLEKAEKSAKRGTITSEALGHIAKAVIDHTGKGKFDSETQALIQGVIDAQKRDLLRKERADEQAANMAKSMEAWTDVGNTLRDLLNNSWRDSLSDIVGREPAP